MRSKYRVYVCPENECAAMGRDGARCPAHDALLIAVIVQRVKPETKAQRENRELLAKLEKMRKSDPMAGIDDLMKSVDQIFGKGA